MCKFIPLVAIKRIPGSDQLSVEVKDDLVAIINEYIQGKFGYEDAKLKSEQLCGTSAVIDYVTEVLHTKFDPIPKQKYRNDLVTFRKQHGGNWSAYEDMRLVMAAEMYQPPNWSIISSFVGSRNKYQCAQRWERTLNPSIIKDPWTEEENKLLILGVQKFGLKAWHDVSRFVGTRTDVQCRYHYKNSMTKSAIKKVQRILRTENKKKTVQIMQVEPEEQSTPIPSDPLSFLDKLEYDDKFLQCIDFL